MYYQFSDFYKRDVSFVFDDENNNIEYSIFNEGISIDGKEDILYQVDKIDDYISSYDLLPTIGPILVSKKFKELFLELSDKQIQFIPATIKDEKGNENNDFFALNILNIVSCMNMKTSVTEKTRYGTLKIKKLMFIANSLKNLDIVRMKEHLSYIIVNQNFKDKCSENNLNGIHFMEEGYSIYTDV
ncbi:hypothetical protein Q4599_17105 [Cellulophaga lytica]|uniref:imm11 family protein n=1 Tax=Cellulophaga lytica TaxID=979 RepID=UPI0026E3904D|nr:DUF1629 domain-containing protein [Cellulophaga lytica]MDO6855304.1 hypothetical protein [Cellulophaga lytica]